MYIDSPIELLESLSICLSTDDIPLLHSFSRSVGVACKELFTDGCKYLAKSSSVMVLLCEAVLAGVSDTETDLRVLRRLKQTRSFRYVV